MQATAARMFDRYKLPRFAMGVDGMMVRIERAPRSFPPGLALQDINCRKNFWALKCQLVCIDEMLISDGDCDWP
jgi:hypothetical protein